MTIRWSQSKDLLIVLSFIRWQYFCPKLEGTSCISVLFLCLHFLVFYGVAISTLCHAILYIIFKDNACGHGTFTNYFRVGIYFRKREPNVFSLGKLWVNRFYNVSNYRIYLAIIGWNVGTWFYKRIDHISHYLLLSARQTMLSGGASGI